MSGCCYCLPGPSRPETYTCLHLRITWGQGELSVSTVSRAEFKQWKVPRWLLHRHISEPSCQTRMASVLHAWCDETGSLSLYLASSSSNPSPGYANLLCGSKGPGDWKVIWAAEIVSKGDACLSLSSFTLWVPTGWLCQVLFCRQGPECHT